MEGLRRFFFLEKLLPERRLCQNQVRSGSGFGKIITFAIRNRKTDFGPNLIEPDWMLCTNPEKIHFLAQKNQVRSGSGQIRCEKIWLGATLINQNNSCIISVTISQSSLLGSSRAGIWVSEIPIWRGQTP